MGLVLSRRHSSRSQFDITLSSPGSSSRDFTIVEEDNHRHEDSQPILPTNDHATDHTSEKDNRVEHGFSDHVCSPTTGSSSTAEDEDSTSDAESKMNQDGNEMTIKSTRAEEKFYRIILFFFSIVNFILLACIISIWVANLRQKDIKHEESHAAVETLEPEDSSFCLPCEEIYMNSLEVQQNRFQVRVTRDEKNNMSLCCDKEHSDLKHFAQSMYLRVHYQRDRARGVIALTNSTGGANTDLQLDSLQLAWILDAAGHLTETQGKFAVPLQRRDTTSAPSPRFLALENNVVKIIEKGLYYLYSQVPFKLSAAVTQNARNLTQFVYRLRPGTEELLLKNSVSPCQLVDGAKLQSFVGGLFLLEKDDTLCLRVSDATAVDGERKFQFGVHHI